MYEVQTRYEYTDLKYPQVPCLFLRLRCCQFRFNESYRVEAEEIDDQDIEALEELASRPDDDEDGK